MKIISFFCQNLKYLTIDDINPLNFEKWMALFQQNQNIEITINSLKLSDISSIYLMNESLYSSIISLDLSKFGFSILSRIQISIGKIIQKCMKLKNLIFMVVK